MREAQRIAAGYRYDSSEELPMPRTITPVEVIADPSLEALIIRGPFSFAPSVTVEG